MSSSSLAPPDVWAPPALVCVEDVPLFHFWSGHSTALWTASQNQSLAAADAELLGPQSIELAHRCGCRVLTVDLSRSRADHSFVETLFRLVGKKGLELVIKIDSGRLADVMPKGSPASASALCLVWTFEHLATKDPQELPDLKGLLSGRDLPHVELVTPVPPPGCEIARLSTLVRQIAACNPDIPWHLVRLRQTDKQSDDTADLIAFFRKARRALSHVYLENLPLSQWLDTVCPDCGSPCTDRIVLRHDRAFLSNHTLDAGGTCRVCGRDVGFRGDICVPAALPEGQRDPRTGFITIENWETAVDLGSGRPLRDATINPMYGFTRDHPFPKDLSRVDEWVVDMAHETISRYEPNLLVLHTASLTDPEIASSPSARDTAIKKLEGLIGELLSKTEYKPLVLGFGAPSPQTLIAAGSKSVVVADERIACFHGGEKIRETLEEMEEIEKVLSRQQMSAALRAPLDPKIYSDTFAVAALGHRFSSTLIPPLGTPAPGDRDRAIPIWDEGGNIGGVWELRRAIASRVLKGRKVALVLIEGLGLDGFGFSDKKIRCHPEDLPLSTSMLLSTISAGRVRVPYEFVPAPWALRTLSNPLALGMPFDNDCLTFDIMNRRKFVAVISGCSGRAHRVFPGQLCIERLPAVRDAWATLIACV